jgi:DNA-directed RNA polymerase specialized sigma24 family protein
MQRDVLWGVRKMLDRKLRYEAIRLRNEDKLSYREISLKLNVSRDTVKSWLRRASVALLDMGATDYLVLGNA